MIIIYIRKRRIVVLLGCLAFVLYVFVYFSRVPPSSKYENPKSQDWKWDQIFSFVPPGKVKCQDLFTPEELADPYNEEYIQAMEEFTDYINQNDISIMEGYCASYQEENMAIWRLARAPFIKVVCETGFNAGHSALMWLVANPDIKVYSFDLGQYQYSYQMANYLQSKFPGRLELTWGDSRYTLYDFRFNNPHVTCDLILIDGGHVFNVLDSDYRNLYNMANLHNIVILDNYPDPRFEDLAKVWEGGKEKGTIEEKFSCSYLPEKKQGFSFGRFVKKT